MIDQLSILFVCLGNICRSPLAEAAFNSEIQKKGLKAHVASAGLGHWHIGDPPDQRAIQEAAKHGIDIRHYRGRQVTINDFYQFTHMIAMDRENLRRLKAMAPKDCKIHLSLLMDYVPGRQGQEVPDPYYGIEKDFEDTWSQVDQGAKALVKHLEEAI